MNEQTITTIALIVFIVAIVIAVALVVGPMLAGFTLPAGILR